MQVIYTGDERRWRGVGAGWLLCNTTNVQGHVFCALLVEVVHRWRGSEGGGLNAPSLKTEISCDITPARHYTPLCVPGAEPWSWCFPEMPWCGNGKMSAGFSVHGEVPIPECLRAP